MLLLRPSLKRTMTPTQRKHVRDQIADYCVSGEIHQPIIHYSQARPMTHLGKDPRNGFTADCSGFATSAFYWAMLMTGVTVDDPNGRHYDGYGYTGTLLAVNHAHKVPPSHTYLVGDLAIFGTLTRTTHVTICRTPGTVTTSVWTSHGSEAAPYPTRLHYRRDLVGVYRPAALL